jgi:thioredoxin
MIIRCHNCGAKNKVDEQRAAQLQAVCGKCGAKLQVSAGFDGRPLIASDANFASLLESAGNKPMLVDFWAAWCGPCRMIAPIIEALAAESNGQYVVAKLDTDANPQTASRFNISSIPTLMIFRNGQVVDQLVGVQPKPTIEAHLRRQIS